MCRTETAAAAVSTYRGSLCRHRRSSAVLIFYHEPLIIFLLLAFCIFLFSSCPSFVSIFILQIQSVPPCTLPTRYILARRTVDRLWRRLTLKLLVPSARKIPTETTSASSVTNRNFHRAVQGRYSILLEYYDIVYRLGGSY